MAYQQIVPSNFLAQSGYLRLTIAMFNFNHTDGAICFYFKQHHKSDFANA